MYRIFIVVGILAMLLSLPMWPSSRSTQSEIEQADSSSQIVVRSVSRYSGDEPSFEDQRVTPVHAVEHEDLRENNNTGLVMRAGLWTSR
jgi:hypothetical protein